MTLSIDASTLAVQSDRRFVNLLAPRASVREAVELLLPMTVDQFMELIAVGRLPEDATVELLYGIPCFKDRSDREGDPMSHGVRHRKATRKLTALVPLVDSPTRHLQIQLPVVCSEFHAPEPDGSILRGTDDDYSSRMPTAADCLCVFEVADSSLLRDKRDKLPGYAEAGIPLAVLINLVDDAIEIHAQPDRARRQYVSPPVRISRSESFMLDLGDGAPIALHASQLLG